jgi:hypothetical protein
MARRPCATCLFGLLFSLSLCSVFLWSMTSHAAEEIRSNQPVANASFKAQKKEAWSQPAGWENRVKPGTADSRAY